MTDMLDVCFVDLDAPGDGTAFLLAEEKLAIGPVAARLERKMKGALKRAVKAGDFSGKKLTALEVMTPTGLDLDRLVLIGVGDARDLAGEALLTLGGFIYGQIAKMRLNSADCVVELKKRNLDSAAIADIALGMVLRSYTFDKYKTKAASNAKRGGRKTEPKSVTIHCKAPKAAARAFKRSLAVAEGVFLARNLVNEPANTLGPVEFAAAAAKLGDLGVEVEILDEDRLHREKMGALLAVGQGSDRPSRVVVMRWSGAKSKRTKPVAFVGKGVVFDTGGISLKPGKGMEDMKGDMGGAACVVGLMHTLATRKAALNAVGIIGLVENMPSAKAMRPGDVITSMSGQTIEVLNTDAEGRLVIGDLIHYVQAKHSPKAMVDLATLTGAILVALGQEHAGLFSNNDRLAARIEAAGRVSGEQVWRMPLGPAYDKQIDSKIADMRNIGQRWGGAITAAQFLKRFVKDTPWAHLDIAGTAMASKRTEINQSWGSGFGVRLLDRFIADTYE